MSIYTSLTSNLFVIRYSLKIKLLLLLLLHVIVVVILLLLLLIQSTHKTIQDTCSIKEELSLLLYSTVQATLT